MISPGTDIVQDKEEGVLTYTALKILRVAAESFYEQDFNSVGMRMVASQTIVRGRSPYHYFASKKEILFAIILEATRDFIADHPPTKNATVDFEQYLQMLVEHHFYYFCEHRHALGVGYREMYNLTVDHQEIAQKCRLQYQTQHSKIYQDWHRCWRIPL